MKQAKIIGQTKIINSDDIVEDIVSKNYVPYIVQESDMVRLDRTIKRLWICILVLIVLLVASNAGWLYYESQFEGRETTETVTTTQKVDQKANGDSNNTFIGGGADGGEADDNNKD